MRRLPSGRMLDQAIADHTWTKTDIQRVGILLAEFYKHSRPVPMTGSEYRKRLREDLNNTQKELSRPEYSMPTDLVDSVVAAALKSLDKGAARFDERAGKIIEAHGDLRPEHICLEPQPVIIDCLEFNRALRLLDPASELTFLALECERLGAPDVGELVLNTYRDLTGDKPVELLLTFYKSYHACVRAQIALWHLRDHDPSTSPRWIQRAMGYLQLAASRC
jgi:aminoglycoside phosphotransferase family enzyme